MVENTEKKMHCTGMHWFKSMAMTKMWLFVFLSAFCSAVLASSADAANIGEQQNVVTGVVKDGATGETLTGVTVVVKGTQLGALTDIQGKFSINVPQEEVTLMISFIGYTAQEILARVGTPVDVALALEVTQISEVVVIGYGVQKKESVVGAITQVNSEALMRSPTQNVTNAITGKLSGVLTIQQTGQPGSDDSEIIIRGLSSWSGSQPLVMVDGVQRDFSDLDPGQINTISVLKDASATAVFGAKGANGVIIVTTKRGALGKPRFTVSSQTGIEKATRLPDHIDAFTTMSMWNVALKNEQRYGDLISNTILGEYQHPSSPLKSLQYPDVNYFDILMKDFAPTTNANINVQGGTDFVKYFCSLAYLYEGDYFKSYRSGYNSTSNFFHRFNYRANLDFSLTKTTQLSLNLGGDFSVRNNANSGYWGDMYFSSTTLFPAYFPAWLLEMVPDPDYPADSGIRLSNALGDWSGNPYTRMNSGGFTQNTGSKLYTDLIFTQKLDFLLKGLSLKANASLSTSFETTSLTSSYSFPEYTLDYSKIHVDENGEVTLDSNPWFRIGQGNEVYKQNPLDINVGGLNGGYYRNLYYEFSINYMNSFGKNNISGLLLMNRQEQYSGTNFPYYNEAFVGRATYDYSRKYLFEVNIGYTGSERFAPGNRFGFFPSGALGWVVSEEDFFRNAVPWMNKLKIRYSQGLVGSDYASARWLYKSDYYYDSRGYIREDRGANTTAQWEEAMKRDLGFEFGFFKNLVTLNVDLFDEYRDKMLLTPRSVTFLVGNSFKDLNLGSLKKHGIEVEIEYNKTTSYNLNYFIKGIFGFNENRILNKDDLPYAPEYSKDAGKPLGAELSGVELTGTGYFTSVDDIHNNPAPVTPDKLVLGDYKFLDYTADGLITTLDMHPIPGNNYPPITYSLSGGISYKGFNFNMMFQGNAGKYVDFFGSYDIEFRRNTWRVNTAQLNYWRPDNQITNDHPTLHAVASSTPQLNWGGGESDQYSIRVKDHSWRNSDYLRLKEVYAGYTFNTAGLTKAIGISNLNVYLSANNLFTITPLIEGDPERKSFANGYYPIFSTYNLGVKFGF